MESPEDVLAMIWRELGQAVHLPGHAWRFGVLATAAPAARLLVLRGVDAEGGLLTAYTDVRSEKVQQIRTDPRVEWLFWHSDGMQLRLRCTAVVQVEGERVEQSWAGLSLPARREYAGLALPGAAIEGPAAEQSDEEVARQNFALLRCRAETIECLQLGQGGVHRRLRFARAQGWRGTWHAP